MLTNSNFRLGGIPVGVILPEVRPVEKIVPPDPADPTSETRVSFYDKLFFYVLETEPRQNCNES